MSNSVSISQAKRILTDCLSKNPSKFKPLLQGAPGTAKTSLVRQFADAIGYQHVAEVILSQMAPEHITGYPYVENGVMKYALPAWWPTEPKTVLFIDEIGQCPGAVQNVAMQLIHERRVGPHILPDDCIVIAAGNRSSDRAGSSVLHTALRSRFFPVIEVNPTADEWVEHAKAAEFNAFVIAYIVSIAKKVVDFDPKEKGGFMTLRTLEQAGDILDVYNNDADNPDCAAALHGVLGQNHASALLAFIATYARMPSIDDIVKNPDTADVAPDMVDAIAKMLGKNARFTAMAAVVRYIRRYGPEAQTRLVADLSPALQRHPDVEALKSELGV
jgi:MoxR-like ATPase